MFVFRCFCVFTLLCGTLFSAESLSLTKLRVKQPSWIPVVVDTHSQGGIKALVYFEPTAAGEIPVKRLQFDLDGKIIVESDVAEKGDRTIVNHGPEMLFDELGRIESIRFYSEGVVHGPAKTYYSDGVLASVVDFDQGVLSGSYEKFHSNEKPALKAAYNQGRLNGGYQEFYPNGQPSFSAVYQQGLLQGEASEWYQDGSLKARYYYLNGLLHGSPSRPAVTRYHENRAIASSQDFRLGQPIGTHSLFSPQGIELEKVNYVKGLKQGSELALDHSGEYDHGILIGDHYRKHANGVISYEAHYDAKGHLLRPIIEFDEEGKKRLEYTDVFGELQGEWKEYYPNGKLRKNYNYKNGEHEGVQEDFFESGTPSMRVRYQNGVKDGLYQEWNEAKSLLTQIHFSDGLRDGSYQKWYANGQQKIDRRYIKGNKEGRESIWSESGVLVHSAEYKNGVPEGLVEAWYPSGNPRSRQFYQNGELHGDFLSWFDDGAAQSKRQFFAGRPVGNHLEYHPLEEGQAQYQLAKDLTYVNGFLEGEQKAYYPDGKAKTVMSYKNHVLDGLKKVWDRHGELVEEANYLAGQLHGRYYVSKVDGRGYVYHYQHNILEGLHQIYYPPHQFFGVVKSLEGNYVNGVFDGEVVEFNQAGTKIASTLYNAGLKDGLVHLYTNEGRLKVSAQFKNDDQEGSAVEYHPNGSVARDVLFIKNQKEGEEKSYFENGRLSSLYVYKAGKLDGLCCEWNPKGILLFEGEYRDGKREGRFNKYDESGKATVIQIYANNKLIEKKKVEE